MPMIFHRPLERPIIARNSFYVTPLGWHPFDGNTGLVVGVEHQSNGRSGTLSRSWNRVYAELLYENGDWLYFLKPWYRIQEDEKLDPSLPEGDDNPDIADYIAMLSLALAMILATMKW